MAVDKATQLRGVALALASFAIYATHDVLIKYLGGIYSPFQIVFFSVLFGFPMMALFLIRDAQGSSLRAVHPVWMALRTAIIVVNAATAVLVVMTVGTYGLKSAGPLVLGDWTLPVRLRQIVDLLPAALFAALAIVSTVGEGRSVVIDARLVGLFVAGIALWRRAPFVLVIVLASAATAFTRLVT